MKTFERPGRIALVLALLNASASAGLFTGGTPLAPDNARQIKRLAVISTLGNTLRGANVGITVFQNRFFETEVPDWRLDATISAYMQERIAASDRLSAKVESLAVSKSDKKVILDAAREQGFDAVIGALPERDPGNQFVYFRPTLFVRPTSPDVYACAGMAVRIWRVSDGKEIGFSQPPQCNSVPISGVAWHKSWDDFTPDERQRALESVQSFIEQEILHALADLKLEPLKQAASQ